VSAGRLAPDLIQPARSSPGAGTGLRTEVARFSAVGAAGFLVDVGLFNVLTYVGSGVLAARPLRAKGLSVLAATMLAFVANRSWTYGARERGEWGRTATRSS
jgi:putative flippase GtrA